jgi:hypothetical protein
MEENNNVNQIGNQSKTFLSEKKQRMVAVVAVVVALVLVVAYSSSNVPSTSKMTTEQKKEAIMALVSKANSTPLTLAQKQSVFQELKGANAEQYQLTPAEKTAILKALNKK